MTAVLPAPTPTSPPTPTDDSPELFLDRRGSGPALVLLHGLGESSVGWHPVMDRLAEHFDVLAFDLPGFGQSPALPADRQPTSANLAAAVGAELRRHGVASAAVAGYSLGARVALQLAASPSVSAVVAIGPDGLGTPWERWQGYWYLSAARMMAAGLAPLAPWLSQSPAGRAVFFTGNRSLPWQLGSADARELLEGYADSASFDATNRAGALDVARHLPSIRQPVLILQGTNDPMTPQVLRYLGVLPNVRWRWLAGAHHVPISDDPGAVVAAMREFLATSDAPSAAE